MAKKMENFEIIKTFKTKQELVQFYNHKSLSIGSNECGLHDFRMRKPAPARVQEHYTLHFVLRGKGTYILAGKTFPISENDIFVTPTNIRLETIPDKDDPWKYFWIGFDGVGAPEICKSAKFSVADPVYSCKDCAKKIRSAIKRMIDFLPASDAAMRMQGLSLLLEIFSLITDERSRGLDSDVSVYSREYYLQQTINILEANYTDPEFKIQTLCENLSVSHSYLCRVFKQLSGATVTEYLMQIRMREARVLLDKNELAMNEIAFKCGFNDYAYFSKSFKKIFSMSPKQYRNIQIHQNAPKKKEKEKKS